MPSAIQERGAVDVRLQEEEAELRDYLRPNRYFRFYLFKERETNTTCWLPEGFFM